MCPTLECITYCTHAVLLLLVGTCVDAITMVKREYYIPNRNHLRIWGITETECMQACFSETSLTCKSFDYFPYIEGDTRTLCILSTANTADASLATDASMYPGCVYYERLCN